MNKELHDKPDILFFFIFTVIFVLLAAFASLPARAQGKSLETLEREIVQDRADAAKTDAAGYRREAEVLKKQAAQYRELEANARQYAREAADIKDRQGWEKDAEKRAKSAEELEAKAREYIAKADAAEGKATQFDGEAADMQREQERKAVEHKAAEEAYKARREAEEASKYRDKPDVYQLIGVWRFEKDGEPFVIVQKYPGDEAYPYKVEGHSKDRVWEGEYVHDENRAAVLEFTYKPKAEEMNPEIPEKARKSLEGTLEWKLELTMDGNCAAPRMKAELDPGEVEWREDAPEKSSVKGKGEIIESALEKSFEDGGTESFGMVQLYLRMPVDGNGDGDNDGKKKSAYTGDGYNTQIDEVEGLTKAQHFFVNVAMPAETAKERGNTITVEVKSANNDSTTLKLERAGTFNGSFSVVYTHKNPITIADRTDVSTKPIDPPFLSLDYFRGIKGDRISLSVDNGEEVTFSYDEASQTVSVYNSWVQRKIAQHQDSAETLRFFYSAIISSADAPAKSRDEATKKLRMLQNYEAMMESDTIHDYIRMKIGESYFEAPNLFSMTQEAMSFAAEMHHGDAMMMGISEHMRDGRNSPNPLYHGVVWTSGYEMGIVTNAASRSRKEYREQALDIIPAQIAFAMYAAVATLSNAGDAYTLITGEDIFGEKVSNWDRIMAGTELAMMPVMMVGLPKIATMPKLKGGSSAYGSLSGRARRSMQRAKIAEQKMLMNSKASESMAGMPRSLSKAQMKSAGVGSAADAAPSSDKPLSCANAVKADDTGLKPAQGAAPEKSVQSNPRSTLSAAPPPEFAPLPSAPPPLPKLDFNTGRMRTFFGNEKLRFADPDAAPKLPPQKFETCACESMKLDMAEQTGLSPSEMLTFGSMIKAGHVKPGQNMPLKTGYTDAQAQAMVEVTGGQTRALPNQKAMSLEAYDNWKSRGWGVRHVLKTPEGPHAVAFRRLIKNSDGDPEVVFYDPAHGKEIIAPACEYNKMMADGYDVIMFRWNAKPQKPTIVYPKPKTAANAPDLPAPGAKAPDANDALIKQLFPDGKIPPLHVTTREGLKGIMDAGIWEQPPRGGASFSPENVGTLRSGDVVIRIKPGSEGLVEMRDHSSGKVPMFWEKGVGNGKPVTYIPAEHLQWLNPQQTGGSVWRDFPASRK